MAEACQLLDAACTDRLHSLTKRTTKRIPQRRTPSGRPRARRGIDPTNLTSTFTTLLRKADIRRIRFHDLRHSTATLLLEQGIELVVIKELLGHTHIGVTATVYAHVRLRLQRNVIDTLSTALTGPEATGTVDGDEPPPCAGLVR